MIRVGRINHLEIVKKTDFGLFLDAGDYGTSLLPNRFVPPEVEIGQFLDVFFVF